MAVAGNLDSVKALGERRIRADETPPEIINGRRDFGDARRILVKIPAGCTTTVRAAAGAEALHDMDAHLMADGYEGTSGGAAVLPHLLGGTADLGKHIYMTALQNPHFMNLFDPQRWVNLEYVQKNPAQTLLTSQLISAIWVANSAVWMASKTASIAVESTAAALRMAKGMAQLVPGLSFVEDIAKANMDAATKYAVEADCVFPINPAYLIRHVYERVAPPDYDAMARSPVDYSIVTTVVKTAGQVHNRSRTKSGIAGDIIRSMHLVFAGPPPETPHGQAEWDGAYSGETYTRAILDGYTDIIEISCSNPKDPGDSPRHDELKYGTIGLLTDQDTVERYQTLDRQAVEARTRARETGVFKTADGQVNVAFIEVDPATPGMNKTERRPKIISLQHDAGYVMVVKALRPHLGGLPGFEKAAAKAAALGQPQVV